MYDQKRKLYVVMEFVKEHNNQIVTQIEMRFLRSSTNVPDADIEHARAMHGLRIRTSQEIKMFVLQASVYQNVPFTQ